MHRPRPTTVWSRRSTATVVLGAAFVVVGCGSSSSTTAGVQASSSSSGASVAAAQARLQKEETRPTSIGVTAPITGSIPTGKKVVFISCGVPACDTQGPIVAQAAQDLGWTASSVSTKGAPAEVQNAIETAIRQGANAVVLDAASRAGLATQIADMQAAGVLFATCCTVDDIGNGILYNTSTVAQNGELGTYLADLVTADSNGSANTLFVNISAFKILASLGTSMSDAYKAECTGCGFDSIDIPLTALGKDVPDRIVSYLRAHPTTNYIALSVSDSLMPGLPAALSAAGLANKVKIIGQGASPSVYQAIANGQMLAAVPFDYFTVDYLMVDALARQMTGATIPDTAPPHWIVTKANLPSATENFPVVTDYRAQFQKLWGKS